MGRIRAAAKYLGGELPPSATHPESGPPGLLLRLALSAGGQHIKLGAGRLSKPEECCTGHSALEVGSYLSGSCAPAEQW